MPTRIGRSSGVIYSHDLTGVIHYSIVVKVLCWVKPEMEPVLPPNKVAPISASFDPHIGL